MNYIPKATLLLLESKAKHKSLGYIISEAYNLGYSLGFDDCSNIRLNDHND